MRRIALILTLLALAVSAAPAHAQSAGDQQYQDPFANGHTASSKTSGGGGGSFPVVPVAIAAVVVVAGGALLVRRRIRGQG